MPGDSISYLEWKSPHGTPTTGIRSNAGIIEARNKGGNWVDVTAWDRSGTNIVPANLATDTVVAGTLSCTFLGATGVVTGNTFAGTYALVQELDVIQTNGQSLVLAQLSELTTVKASATTDTTIQIPANSIVLGLSALVTSTINITGGGTFSLIGATSTTEFAASIVTDVSTSAVGMANCPYLNLTAQNVRITPSAVPPDATGRVRIVVNYIELTAPTS